MSKILEKNFRKYRPFAIAGLVILIGVVWMLQSRPASAQPGDLESIEAHYPIIEGSRIDTCVLCHSSVPSLNPYGQAYKDNGRNDAAFTAIQGLDSDGDGFTNLQEINALTFPGNASDFPAQSTSTPTVVATATQTPTVVTTVMPGSILNIFIPLLSNQ